MRDKVWLEQCYRLATIVSAVVPIIPLFAANSIHFYSAGDAFDGALALMVVQSCRNIDGGLPFSLWMMMMMNIAFDFVIGLVPFVGDLADALYKCNTRNAILLEKHLREKGARALAGKQQQRPVDPSLPEELAKYDEDNEAHGGPSRPPPARVPRENRSGTGWFGKQREPDLETGVVRN